MWIYLTLGAIGSIAGAVMGLIVLLALGITAIPIVTVGALVRRFSRGGYLGSWWGWCCKHE